MTTSEQVFHDTVTGPPPQGRVMELITSLWTTHVTAAIARRGVPVQLGAGRMLFGTDHPYAAPSVPQDLVERLPCTQAEREQILAGNAQRLLRLDAAVAGRA